ncbi:MAG: hypothetical protein M1818_001903 [Claussenomyces sp. TS43310]|nr:MAG: hypothetical protein M1818_001903 [Claussenomyces sp. TS43310]
MSRFYFDGDSGSISSADDEDNLPYPEALPRNDFLASNFDAPTYLSTLSSRHQTLEDLRSDLRERSQLLSKELLDLVNTNYEHFLGLGSELKGGEERVEDVRVGLLGFKRGVEDVRSKVTERGQQVATLLQERIQVSRQIALGRKLLEFDARLDDLEEKLMVASLARSSSEINDMAWSGSDDDDDESDESDDHGRAEGTGVLKLQQLVQEYCSLENISATVGSHQPFIDAQSTRLSRIKNTLLLDLGTALKQANSSPKSASGHLLKLMSIYCEMSEGAEAIKVLNSLKS